MPRKPHQRKEETTQVDEETEQDETPQKQKRPTIKGTAREMYLEDPYVHDEEVYETLYETFGSFFNITKATVGQVKTMLRKEGIFVPYKERRLLMPHPYKPIENGADDDEEEEEEEERQSAKSRRSKQQTKPSGGKKKKK
jgi:hypothetical protein